jgi:hypothetical protein
MEQIVHERLPLTLGQTIPIDTAFRAKPAKLILPERHPLVVVGVGHIQYFPCGYSTTYSDHTYPL